MTHFESNLVGRSNFSFKKNYVIQSSRVVRTFTIVPFPRDRNSIPWNREYHDTILYTLERCATLPTNVLGPFANFILPMV